MATGPKRTEKGVVSFFRTAQDKPIGQLRTVSGNEKTVTPGAGPGVAARFTKWLSSWLTTQESTDQEIDTEILQEYLALGTSGQLDEYKKFYNQNIQRIGNAILGRSTEGVEEWNPAQHGNQSRQAAYNAIRDKIWKAPLQRHPSIRTYLESRTIESADFFLKDERAENPTVAKIDQIQNAYRHTSCSELTQLVVTMQNAPDLDELLLFNRLEELILTDCETFLEKPVEQLIASPQLLQEAFDALPSLRKICFLRGKEVTEVTREHVQHVLDKAKAIGNYDFQQVEVEADMILEAGDPFEEGRYTNQFVIDLSRGHVSSLLAAQAKKRHNIETSIFVPKQEVEESTKELNEACKNLSHRSRLYIVGHGAAGVHYCIGEGEQAGTGVSIEQIVGALKHVPALMDRDAEPPIKISLVICHGATGVGKDRSFAYELCRRLAEAGVRAEVVGFTTPAPRPPSWATEYHKVVPGLATSKRAGTKVAYISVLKQPNGQEPRLWAGDEICLETAQFWMVRRAVYAPGEQGPLLPAKKPSVLSPVEKEPRLSLLIKQVSHKREAMALHQLDIMRDTFATLPRDVKEAVEEYTLLCQEFDEGCDELADKAREEILESFETLKLGFEGDLRHMEEYQAQVVRALEANLDDLTKPVLDILNNLPEVPEPDRGGAADHLDVLKAFLATPPSDRIGVWFQENVYYDMFRLRQAIDYFGGLPGKSKKVGKRWTKKRVDQKNAKACAISAEPPPYAFSSSHVCELA